MNNINAGTLTRTILLWLAILNQISTALHLNPLPLDDNTVSTIITTVFALWAWWKNNDFTHAAKEGTKVTQALKQGQSVEITHLKDVEQEFTTTEDR